jgi:hypothetical protein
MKQHPGSRRLIRMHASMHQIVISTLRRAVMLGLAMLLILRIFPAVLEAQAGRN